MALDKRIREILAVVFVAALFLIGGVTLWNCRHVVKQIATGGVEDARAELEEAITDEFAVHDEWININGGFQRLLGVTIVRGASGNTYKLSNGQIMYGTKDKNMKARAKDVIEFRDELAEAGIDFMYVQYPFKIENDDAMPPGTRAYGNDNADGLVKRLRNAGVDTIDIKEHIYAEGLDWASLFFKTDHHWTPLTGLWASGKIAEHIGEKYGLDIDMSCYDPENYDTVVYKDWMLGSLGRRTGAWYVGVEDFYLLNPKFETDFDFWGKVGGDKIERSGSFWDSMYDFSKLEGKKASFNVNTFSTYTGGQYKTARWTNKLAKNDFKVLMIRDSYSDVVVPFLDMNVSEITSIDMRKYKKSVLEYAKKYNPDLVIVAYNPSAFSKKQFDFCGD